MRVHLAHINSVHEFRAFLSGREIKMALESDAFFFRLRIYALAIRAAGNLLAVVPRRPLLFFLGLVHKLEETDDLQASQTWDAEFVSPAIQFAHREKTQIVFWSYILVCVADQHFQSKEVGQ